MLLYAGSIVLLPLYTHCLSPAEFGALELLGRVGEVLNLCLLFTAVRQAAITFYNQATDEAERRRVAATVLLLLLAINGVGAAIMAAVSPSLSAHLEVGGATLIQLAAWGALLEGTTFVLMSLPQARTESGFFVLVNVGQLLVRVGLCATLVGVLGWGVRGVVVGCGVTSALFAAGVGIREAWRSGLRADGAKVREMARFCLPFLPGGLCLFILNSGDRFLLLRWGGPEAVGIYSLGYKIAGVVTTLTVTPLLMVWSARMYDAAKLADAAGTFGRMTTRILAVNLLAGLGVCLFQDEAIRFLGGNRYAGAAAVIAPVMLGYWFLSANSLMDAGFYVRRRTILKTWVTLAATALVLGLYALLIPVWGALGAALATVGGFAFQALLTRCVVQRIFPVRYEDGRLAALLALAVGIWLVSRLLPAAAWAAPLKLVLWSLCPAALWQGGWLADEEKQSLMGAFAQVRSRLRTALLFLMPLRTG